MDIVTTSKNASSLGSISASSSLARLSSNASQMIRDNIHRNLPRSPFRFLNRASEDERLAMSERFRAEGLDARKLTDGQKLPYVWRWLVDADINCLSLRHQIDKMKRQHEEDLQQVESYIEQIWKLSTQRLLVLEDENKLLKQQQQQQCTTTRSKSSSDKTVCVDRDKTICVDRDKIVRVDRNKNHIRETQQQSISFTTQEDDSGGGDDSDEELRKCLNGVDLLQGLKPRVNDTRLVNSISSFSLSSSGVSLTFNDSSTCCDNPRPNQYVFPRSASTSNFLSTSLQSTSPTTITKAKHKKASKPNDKLCEQCEQLARELTKLSEVYEATLVELSNVSEKNCVLDKLNRCIEIENENFAFKLGESESQNEQLERQLFVLEQKYRQVKNMNRSDSTNNNKILVESRLIEELNDKVKHLEEKLDLSLQAYEELQSKSCRRKEKHKQTIDKLRRFMLDTKAIEVATSHIKRNQSEPSLQHLSGSNCCPP